MSTGGGKAFFRFYGGQLGTTGQEEGNLRRILADAP